MKNKILTTITLMLLLISLASAENFSTNSQNPPITLQDKTEEKTITKDCITPENGMKISENTIFCEGTYNLPDGIKITNSDVELTCEKTKLIGENKGTGISIKRISEIKISGCEIQNYELGIDVLNTQNTILENLHLSDNNKGIHLRKSENVKIIKALAEENKFGIELVGTYQSLIQESSVTQNTVGINLRPHENGRLSGNIEIKNNDIKENRIGIRAKGRTSSTSISANSISNNKEGLLITGQSHDIKIFQNTFETNSQYGTYLKNAFSNTFYNNKFLNNRINAFEEADSYSNQWDFNSIGNYWSDLEQNPGYPNDEYLIDGPGEGVDKFFILTP